MANVVMPIVVAPIVDNHFCQTNLCHRACQASLENATFYILALCHQKKRILVDYDVTGINKEGREY